jgi:hypothetical protein
MLRGVRGLLGAASDHAGNGPIRLFYASVVLYVGIHGVSEGNEMILNLSFLLDVWRSTRLRVDKQEKHRESPLEIG